MSLCIQTCGLIQTTSHEKEEIIMTNCISYITALRSFAGISAEYHYDVEGKIVTLKEVVKLLNKEEIKSLRNRLLVLNDGEDCRVGCIMAVKHNKLIAQQKAAADAAKTGVTLKVTPVIKYNKSTKKMNLVKLDTEYTRSLYNRVSFAMPKNAVDLFDNKIRMMMEEGFFLVNGKTILFKNHTKDYLQFYADGRWQNYGKNENDTIAFYVPAPRSSSAANDDILEFVQKENAKDYIKDVTPLNLDEVNRRIKMNGGISNKLATKLNKRAAMNSGVIEYIENSTLENIGLLVMKKPFFSGDGDVMYDAKYFGKPEDVHFQGRGPVVKGMFYPCFDTYMNDIFTKKMNGIITEDDYVVLGKKDNIRMIADTNSFKGTDLLALKLDGETDEECYNALIRQDLGIGIMHMYDKEPPKAKYTYNNIVYFWHSHDVASRDRYMEAATELFYDTIIEKLTEAAFAPETVVSADFATPAFAGKLKEATRQIFKQKTTAYVKLSEKLDEISEFAKLGQYNKLMAALAAIQAGDTEILDYVDFEDGDLAIEAPNSATLPLCMADKDIKPQYKRDVNGVRRLVVDIKDLPNGWVLLLRSPYTSLHEFEIVYNKRGCYYRAGHKTVVKHAIIIPYCKEGKALLEAMSGADVDGDKAAAYSLKKNSLLRNLYLEGYQSKLISVEKMRNKEYVVKSLKEAIYDASNKAAYEKSVGEIVNSMKPVLYGNDELVRYMMNQVVAVGNKPYAEAHEVLYKDGIFVGEETLTAYDNAITACHIEESDLKLLREDWAAIARARAEAQLDKSATGVGAVNVTAVDTVNRAIKEYGEEHGVSVYANQFMGFKKLICDAIIKVSSMIESPDQVYHYTVLDNDINSRAADICKDIRTFYAKADREDDGIYMSFLRDTDMEYGIGTMHAMIREGRVSACTLMLAEQLGLEVNEEFIDDFSNKIIAEDGKHFVCIAVDEVTAEKIQSNSDIRIYNGYKLGTSKTNKLVIDGETVNIQWDFYNTFCKEYMYGEDTKYIVVKDYVVVPRTGHENEKYNFKLLGYAEEVQ